MSSSGTERLNTAFSIFHTAIDKLEVADSGQTTVLFCTDISQVRRLIIQQNLLAKELRMKPLKFADEYQDSFVTQQNNHLISHPQYHHLPFVCLTYQ